MQSQEVSNLGPKLLLNLENDFTEIYELKYKPTGTKVNVKGEISSVYETKIHQNTTIYQHLIIQDKSKKNKIKIALLNMKPIDVSMKGRNVTIRGGVITEYKTP